MAALAERVRPLVLAADQLLPVVDALASLLPRGGLVRGQVTATASHAASPTGATSLAVALAAGAVSSGSWAAVVGVDGFGLAAAHDLGLSLDRVAIVAAPPPASWPTVVAALLDGFDLVLVGPPPRLAATAARRLGARVRERGAVLVQVGWPPGRWPEPAELAVTVEASVWEGIGQGWGSCRARRVAVAVGGRRGADRPRRGWLWLPDEHGRVTTAPAPDEVHELGGRPALSIVAPVARRPSRAWRTPANSGAPAASPAPRPSS